MNYGTGNVKGKGGSAENYFLASALIPTFNSQSNLYEIDSSYVIDLATQQPVDLTKYDTTNNKYEINIISPSPLGEVAYEGKFIWQSTDNTTTPPTLKGVYMEISSGGGSQLYQHNIGYDADGSAFSVHLTIITDNDTPFTASTLASWLKSNGFDYTNNYKSNVYEATGGYRASSSAHYVWEGIYSSNGTSLNAIGRSTSDGSNYSTWVSITSHFDDKVKPL